MNDEQQVSVPAPVKPSGYRGPLTSVQWSMGSAAIAIGLFFLGILGWAALNSFATLPDLTGVSEAAARLAIYYFPYLLSLLYILWVIRRQGETLAEGLGLRRFEPGAGTAIAVGGSCFGRFLTLAVTLLLFIVLAPFGVEPSDLDVTGMFATDAAGIIALVLLVGFLAPFAEEVVFRGVLLPAIGERWGMGWGVVASSVAFGLIHGDIWLIVPTFFLGLLLGWMYLATRSLWVPIIAHIAYNLVAVAIQYSLTGLTLTS